LEYKKVLHLVRIKNYFMKKLLLSIGVVFVGFAANAQCTPLQSWADTTDYGVYPDTIQNFPPAAVNVAYSSDLNFKVPATVTAEVAGDDPLAQNFIGSEIEGFVVTSVEGLPAGYDYACNIPSCEYDGGANGCANVFGTTSTTGTYDIIINVTATVIVQLPLLPPTPQDVPTSFTGYKIVVGTAGNIEEIIPPVSVSPNPANDVIKVAGITASKKASNITITNIEGKVVAKRNVENATDYEFDLSGVNAGIYFVNVAHANGVETVKFVKQ
jgi:hypothetical protein